MIRFYKPLALMLILGSCADSSNNDSEGNGIDSTSVEATTAESGLIIEMIQEGNGEQPSQGDIVTVHYTGTLKASGEKFDSSLDRGEPIEFPLGVGRVIPGWEEGIAMLSKGSKAKFIIPAHLAYGEQGSGNVIPPNSDLIFEVELIDFREGPKPIVHEPNSMDGMKIMKTESGLQYAIVEKGDGPKAGPGKTVTVHYYGYLKESGEKFDSSFDRCEPFPVQLGARQVIPGWEEGLALLKVGDKATFFIPSTLAYGEQGIQGVIPPNAELVFDVEVLDVQ
jgi:peptidylprolyl isomerase